MINYVEYLNVPTKIAIGIVAFFFVLQIVGEILEFKGKAVPELMKVRKYFARKKAEQEMLKEMYETFKEVKSVSSTLERVEKLLQKDEETLEEVNKHYAADNITMRDDWMGGVNYKLECNERQYCDLSEKIDKINEGLLSLLISSKRNKIIEFASFCMDKKNPAIREQYKQIFKQYKEYEDIIKENDMTNGEVDVAITLIREAYEDHLKDHSFVENMRGYN